MKPELESGDSSHEQVDDQFVSAMMAVMRMDKVVLEFNTTLSAVVRVGGTMKQISMKNISEKVLITNRIIFEGVEVGVGLF